MLLLWLVSIAAYATPATTQIARQNVRSTQSFNKRTQARLIATPRDGTSSSRPFSAASMGFGPVRKGVSMPLLQNRERSIVASNNHAFSSASIPSADSDRSAGLLQYVNESVAASKKALATLWKFSRPHTIIGTITSVVALHMMMIPSNVGMLFALSPLFLKVVAPTLISALLLNVYIVGLNQVTDVSIDKVNKPNLPLASGAMSMKQAIGVILTSLIAGLLIGFLPGVTTAPLQFTLVASGLLGTLYSLPPFRFKRFPTSAALCISAVRGFVINWGFAAHAFIKLSSDVATSVPIPDLPLKVTLIAAFYTVYGVVIALAKDVPDVKGDEGHGIRSFSVRLGQDKVLALAQWLLSSVHLAAAGVLLFGGGGGMATSNGRFLAAGLAVLAAESIRRERQDVDAKKPEDSYKKWSATAKR